MKRPATWWVNFSNLKVRPLIASALSWPTPGGRQYSGRNEASGRSVGARAASSSLRLLFVECVSLERSRSVRQARKVAAPCNAGAVDTRHTDSAAAQSAPREPRARLARQITERAPYQATPCGRRRRAPPIYISIIIIIMFHSGRARSIWAPSSARGDNLDGCWRRATFGLGAGEPARAAI